MVFTVKINNNIMRFIPTKLFTLMVAKIYKPVKTAMQSGKGNTKKWLLEYELENSSAVDTVMGWTGNSDPKAQLRLRFESSAEAEKYAQLHKIAYVVIQPKIAKLKKRTYAENFQ